MIPRNAIAAKALMLVLASYPQFVSSEGFTVADVLAWDRESQEAYIQNSVSMVMAMTAQKPDSKAFANCVGDWFGNKDMHAKRTDELVSYFEGYPTYHPQSIILVVIENVCGKVFD